MARLSPYISNGTCYVAPGVESDGSFIPCGNDAFGHVNCCKAGDKCLMFNACYDAEFGLTYLLGCSDPDYADESCPDKKGVKNGGWVGLVTCSGTNEWMPCSQDSRPSTLKKADSCTCTPENPHPTAFIVGGTELPDVGSLPTRSGGTIRFSAGHLPTVTVLPTPSPTAATPGPTPTPTATPSSEAAAEPTAAPPTADTTTGVPNPVVTNPNPNPTVPTQTLIITATPSTDPVPPPPTSSSALSTGAKAGIGAGAGVGGLALLAALIYFFLILPRRRAQKRQDEQHPAYVPVGGGTAYPHTETKEVINHAYNPSTPGTIGTSTVSELDSKGARPWSLRSELPGGPGESPQSVATAFEDNRGVGDRRSADSRYVGAGFGSETGLGVQGHGGGGQQAGQRRLNTWAELA